MVGVYWFESEGVDVGVKYLVGKIFVLIGILFNLLCDDVL